MAATKPLIIFHANCWDGFCAAWVAKARFRDIEAVPAHYGTEPPDVSDRRVFILDFSYPRSTMLALCKAADSVVVLDHHQTAQSALDGLVDQFISSPDYLAAPREVPMIVFDMTKSGARLTWEFFYPNAAAPWLVEYTEDRDLWRHALPETHAVNAAIRSYPLEYAVLDDFNACAPGDYVREGTAIRRREQQIVADHVRNARRENFDGTWTVPIVNATTLCSEIAGELAKGEPFAACYFDRQDGKRQWSLRSDPQGVDVSAIAVTHGGGGHRHAAGFETVIA